MLAGLEQTRELFHLDDDSVDVLNLATVEAERFNHNYLGTEHLLLGLTRSPHSELKQVLTSVAVDTNKVQSAVEFIIGRGERIVTGDIGITPRARKVMEFSWEEARILRRELTTPPFILMGLVREGEGIACGVLESLGVSLDKVRGELRRAVDSNQPKAETVLSPGLFRSTEPPESLQDRALTRLALAFRSDLPQDRKDILARLVNDAIDLTNPTQQES